MNGHIGFTGTRYGMTPAQCAAVARLLRDGAYDTLHHGDCVGADKQAHNIAREIGLRTEAHPPTNPSRRAHCVADVIHPPAGYIARNHAIVDATCRMIAAPAGVVEEQRSGTWATIRYAASVGKPVSIVFPDGSVRDTSHDLSAESDTCTECALPVRCWDRECVASTDDSAEAVAEIARVAGEGT